MSQSTPRDQVQAALLKLLERLQEWRETVRDFYVDPETALEEIVEIIDDFERSLDMVRINRPN